jgi:hypothetical protein
MAAELLLKRREQLFLLEDDVLFGGPFNAKLEMKRFGGQWAASDGLQLDDIVFGEIEPFALLPVQPNLGGRHIGVGTQKKHNPSGAGAKTHQWHTISV